MIVIYSKDRHGPQNNIIKQAASIFLDEDEVGKLYKTLKIMQWNFVLTHWLFIFADVLASMWWLLFQMEVVHFFHSGYKDYRGTFRTVLY